MTIHVGGLIPEDYYCAWSHHVLSSHSFSSVHLDIDTHKLFSIYMRTYVYIYIHHYTVTYDTHTHIPTYPQTST